ncbi:MAG: type VI secretion system baseplate subunit TssF [Desulfuromonadales bacterium]|nr:type VI secretion system baseplate subunit TssF [Desulfuromonadales bacterium]
MANTTGQTATLLNNDLLSNGHEFTFPQVMRIARMQLGAGGRDTLPEIPWQKRVRVRPDLSFAFPPADVVRVERDDSDLLVTTTFLGLYGSSSPLPTFYTEDLMDEASGDSSVSRDFLDILHQRLYQLYFACWSKYRLFIRVAEEKNHLDRERLFCLIGLGEKELRDSVPDAWTLLRYTGLLTQFPRSAEGLQTLLRDALGILRLEVEQCVLRRVPIPADQRMRMGAPRIRLGTTTVLGSVVSDRMGKFRILIGPLKKRAFDQFLPGAPLYVKLVALVRLYILDPFDFDLKVTLAAHEAGPIRLGDPLGPRLGWTTWCFSSNSLGEVSSRFPLALSAKQDPIAVEEDIPAPEPSTLADYYQRELALLRELTTDYVKIHPEMAPLVSGHMADPGVERIVEGVAFLNAHLRQKLDDDFPEMIHELTETLHPWDLRPIPATTIVQLPPREELKQPLLIRAGAEVASIPVQGIRCRFRTCFDVTVHPLTLQDASFSQPSGKAPSIRLQCELNGIGLSGWKVQTLRFFLADDYPAACDLYLLLMRYLKRIIITSLDNGATIEIPPDRLKPLGFAHGETILTHKKSFMPGHLILQEYFLFHDKFLFMDLEGLEQCSTLGSGARFEINFELTNCPLVVPKVDQKSFVFSATTVINLFPHKAKPISFSNELQQRKVSPSGEQPSHYRIYSVDKVEGLVKKKSVKIMYDVQNQLLHRTKDERICRISHRKSALVDSFDTLLSIASHKNMTRSDRIKLDIDLTCTNGILPEQLCTGDVSTTTASTPESVEPRNIKTFTSALFPDIHMNRQWKLFSGFALNSISLNSAGNFRALLRLFIHSNSRYQVTVMANTRKIDAVESIGVNPADRLIGRSMYRGYDIRLKLRGDHFAGPGDLYLFSAVLERFLGGYVTQNCFIRLVVEEIGKGYLFEWPTRMGDRCVV